MRKLIIFDASLQKNLIIFETMNLIIF